MILLCFQMATSCIQLRFTPSNCFAITASNEEIVQSPVSGVQIPDLATSYRDSEPANFVFAPISRNSVQIERLLSSKRSHNGVSDSKCRLSVCESRQFTAVPRFIPRISLQIHRHDVLPASDQQERWCESSSGSFAVGINSTRTPDRGGAPSNFRRGKRPISDADSATESQVTCTEPYRHGATT